MSLVGSAKMHGHDPWVYLKDVITRLPSHLNSRIDELLPHRWQPQLRGESFTSHISGICVKVPRLAAYDGIPGIHIGTAGRQQVGNHLKTGAVNIQ
jgi:hypothetical protein